MRKIVAAGETFAGIRTSASGKLAGYWLERSPPLGFGSRPTFFTTGLTFARSRSFISSPALALLCFVATCMPMNNSSITYAVRLLGAIMGFGWIVVISVLLAARASRVTSGYQRCG